MENSPSGGLCEVKTFTSVVVTVLSVSIHELSSVVAVDTLLTSVMGGEVGWMVGVAGEASIESEGGASEMGNTRTAASPFGFLASCSSAELGAVVVSAVVTAVVGRTTTGGSVVGGLAEVNFAETVRLTEGAAGGSVDLTVTLGGPGK